MKTFYTLAYTGFLVFIIFISLNPKLQGKHISEIKITNPVWVTGGWQWSGSCGVRCGGVMAIVFERVWRYEMKFHERET